MKLVGVTGGIGMGKSTAGDLLRLSAVSVVDTDVLARELTAVGQPALQEIRAVFGSQYFVPSGDLNRSLLAHLVFNNENAKMKLEAILHPRIEAEWKRVVSNWVSSSISCGAVIIPLLFEKEYQPLFDATVCLACSSDEQLRRLRRRGWSDSEIKARNSAQLPVDQKVQRSRFLVWTEGSLTTHQKQWYCILAELGCLTG